VSNRKASAAIVVRGWAGQLPPDELTRLASIGERPRTPYVELARTLDADVIDANFLQQHGSLLARAAGRRLGTTNGQVVEAFRRRRKYRHMVAFADRIGLELALLFKLARSRRDLVLVSNWLMGSSKQALLERYHVQSHLGDIIGYGSVQLELAAERYGLQKEKLHLELQSVDERFWQPAPMPPESDTICSVGCVTGFRDYATLVEAARGLPVQVKLAVGSLILSAADRQRRADRFRAAIPPSRLPHNIEYRLDLPATALRDLYARSRFVVMPLEDVDFDAGVTSITEAMAMGKAVVVTRNRGQVDVVRDGVDGLYVPGRDPRALREAISYLLENPDVAERMGAAGREAVLKRHKLDDYVARVAEIVRLSDQPLSERAQYTSRPRPVGLMKSPKRSVS
jgi:glycosyltransferase involved in cell wall biosynthesis